MRSFAKCSLLLFSLLAASGAGAGSLDIALAGRGISLGNSPRFTGLRINAVDRGVERVAGLNLTLWTPGPNPDAHYGGVALGLIGHKARRMDGIFLGGVGVNARERLRGIAAGSLGVAAGRMDGLGLGLVMVDVRERFRGIGVGGIWTGRCERYGGLAFSPGLATAQDLRGAAVGGLFAGGGRNLAGLGISAGGVYAARLSGLALAGIAAGGETVKGIVVAGGGIGGGRLDGIMLGGLGLGASERIRGIALGGAVIFAPEAAGLTVGALNGLYIDRINLEDFLHFDLVNRRFTGLSIGLVNYTACLKGVQIGLMNYAGNNPRGLRLLPLINIHL